MTPTFLSPSRYSLRNASRNAIPLALFLVGPFYYYVAAHWFGMAHPAWIVGGYLALTTLALMPQRFGALRRSLNTFDYLMASFLLLALISIGVHGFSEKIRGIYLLAVYVALPYGAARLLAPDEIGLFIKACMALGLVALPITFVELASMPAADLAEDRIRTFLGVYYSNNEAGLVLGLCLVLCTISVLLTDTRQQVPSAFRGMAWGGLAFSAGLLTFLSARGGLVASLCVSAILIFLVRPVSARTRLYLLGTLLVSIMVSAALLPNVRKVFLSQLISAPISTRNEATSSFADSWQIARAKLLGTGESPSVANPGVAPSKDTVSADLLKQRPKILLEGNSPALRLLEYRDAIALFAKSPFWGVGAGNFGTLSPTAEMLSNNALCIDEIKGMYVCPQSPLFSGPHSTILHVLAELGTLGGVLYVALIGFLGRQVYIVAACSKDEDSRSYAWGLGGIWSFYLLTDQFYGNYFTSYQFYLMTGCLVAFLSSQHIGHCPVLRKLSGKLI